MATALENLVAARDSACERLAEAMGTPGAAGYNPNAPGVNADHDGLVRRLRDTIAFLDKEISKLDVYEVTSEMTAW